MKKFKEYFEIINESEDENILLSKALYIEIKNNNPDTKGYDFGKGLGDGAYLSKGFNNMQELLEFKNKLLNLLNNSNFKIGDEKEIKNSIAKKIIAKHKDGSIIEVISAIESYRKYFNIVIEFKLPKDKSIDKKYDIQTKIANDYFDYNKKHNIKW